VHPRRTVGAGGAREQLTYPLVERGAPALALGGFTMQPLVQPGDADPGIAQVVACGTR
jgi:hypothetical protein